MAAKGSMLEVRTTNQTNASVAKKIAGNGVFNWRHGGATESERIDAVVAGFTKCLEAENCPGHRATKRTSMFPWATKVPAFMQEGHVPLHPVKVNTFAKGQQGIEACFKSCLAATCGCNDAPGFDAIAKMDAQVKANDANGDPVEDTPPEYNYRPAYKDECAGGMAGLKISSGLYTALSKGWLEVCTPAYLKAMYVDEKEGAKKCKSNDPANAEYGCVWNNDKGACVWGLKPVARCSVRFLTDKK